MFVNSYKINIKTIQSGTTDTTINIPINIDYQLVDQSELIQKVFVDTEVEKAINPIFDYEKARLSPLTPGLNGVNNMIYSVYFLVNGNIKTPTYYGDINFTNDDIRLKKNSFTDSYLNLNFYDSDKALEQRLINNITLHPFLTSDDLISQAAAIASTNVMPGTPKSVNDIPIRFVLSDIIKNPMGYSEGYYLYDYKDEIPKVIYMRASFRNAKTGVETNLMTEGLAYNIDTLVNKLYTKYVLTVNTTGYYYTIDTTYSNNVSYDSQNNANIKLYQIQAL